MAQDDLYIPTFFRCPISLDVMKSPVSLSTGVTYDRTNIQRWLESGNNTCPATMQVLDSTDFVPNHTLHRLIQIWSRTRLEPEPKSLSSHQALHIITQLISGSHNNNHHHRFESFVKLLGFATGLLENRRFLASNDAFVNYLIRFVASGDPNPNREPDLVETGLKILQIILISSEITAVIILNKHPDFFTSLARILKSDRSDSRLAISCILRAISPDQESKKAVLDNNDLLSTLIEILHSDSTPNPVVESILSNLVFLSSPRTNKLKLVRAGIVRITTVIIRTISSDTTLIELALTLLEMLAGSAEGRAAISEDPNCVSMVVQKLMKVSTSGNEHGVALLWSLCYLFRDQKAKEAVMRSNGGLTKILLLMQSGCSPAVKRMCGDLLRIFRVNYKSCFASYDSKTTHIMPC